MFSQTCNLCLISPPPPPTLPDQMRPMRTSPLDRSTISSPGNRAGSSSDSKRNTPPYIRHRLRPTKGREKKERMKELESSSPLRAALPTFATITKICCLGQKSQTRAPPHGQANDYMSAALDTTMWPGEDEVSNQTMLRGCRLCLKIYPHPRHQAGKHIICRSPSPTSSAQLITSGAGPRGRSILCSESSVSSFTLPSSLTALDFVSRHICLSHYFEVVH